jgi:hypothetical protein
MLGWECDCECENRESFICVQNSPIVSLLVLLYTSHPPKCEVQRSTLRVPLVRMLHSLQKAQPKGASRHKIRFTPNYLDSAYQQTADSVGKF